MLSPPWSSPSMLLFTYFFTGIWFCRVPLQAAQTFVRYCWYLPQSWRGDSFLWSSWTGWPFLLSDAFWPDRKCTEENWPASNRCFPFGWTLQENQGHCSRRKARYARGTSIHPSEWMWDCDHYDSVYISILLCTCKHVRMWIGGLACRPTIGKHVFLCTN